jgi:hypothetical protein
MSVIVKGMVQNTLNVVVKESLSLFLASNLYSVQVIIVNVKMGTLSPCLIDYVLCTDPRILRNLATRKRWEVSSTPQLFYPRCSLSGWASSRASLYTVNRKISWPIENQTPAVTSNYTDSVVKVLHKFGIKHTVLVWYKINSTLYRKRYILLILYCKFHINYIFKCTIIWSFIILMYKTLMKCF